MTHTGRRPDGPGWYWYDGDVKPFGPLSPTRKLDAPVYVDVWGDERLTWDVLEAGVEMVRRLSDYPGDFLPLSKPAAVPAPDWRTTLTKRPEVQSE